MGMGGRWAVSDTSDKAYADALYEVRVLRAEVARLRELAEAVVQGAIMYSTDGGVFVSVTPHTIDALREALKEVGR